MNKASFSLIFLLAASSANAFYYNQYNQSNQVPPITEPGQENRNIPIYPNQSSNDKALTEKLQSVFRSDPILAPYASQIEIYSLNGVVTLAGVVDSERIKLRAEQKARVTLGVRHVENQMSTEKTKSSWSE